MAGVVANRHDNAWDGNRLALAEARVTAAPAAGRDVEPARPSVALLPWGDLLEDFLDSIGVSLQEFCDEMTGGWLFGYVTALASAGVHTVIICVSRGVTVPTHVVHRPTGATLCLLPPSRAYMPLRRLLPSRYGWTVRQALAGTRGMQWVLGLALRELVPYLATPPLRLARELRRHCCSAILCQEYEYPRFDTSVVVGRALGMPVVATFQGGDRPHTRLERLLRPFTVRAASALVIAPASERARVRRQYRVPEARLAEIYNPLDTASWTRVPRAEARASADLPVDVPVVGWHGRVDLRSKGLDVLVTGWRHVEDSTDDAWLLLIGSGDDRSALRRLIREAGLRRVRWIDQYVLDRQHLRTLLSAADVYAFPSRHEGFPVAPVEALALGLPVVAAAAPGISEILAGGERSGGVVVPVGDAVALASALTRLVHDECYRAKLSALARKRATAVFSPEVVGQRLRTVLLG
jgi:starch synthase